MKFGLARIDKFCGQWDRKYGRFKRYILKEFGYQGEAVIDGKTYTLQLFKLTKGWRLGVYGMFLGKDMHYASVEEAEEKAAKAFTAYIRTRGKEAFKRQEYEYNLAKSLEKE